MLATKALLEKYTNKSTQNYLFSIGGRVLLKTKQLIAQGIKRVDHIV